MLSSVQAPTDRTTHPPSTDPGRAMEALVYGLLPRGRRRRVHDRLAACGPPQEGQDRV